MILFALMGALLGAGLGLAARRFYVASNPIVDEIESMMPGGQCGQCGKAGCRQAAEAMVSGELKITDCPPGGSALAVEIGKLLGVSVNEQGESQALLATINESLCSGCTRCYKACPFDAIVGANKQMHTVISEVCTGCQLCVAVCPQSCITVDSAPMDVLSWHWPKPTMTIS